MIGTVRPGPPPFCIFPRFIGLFDASSVSDEATMPICASKFLRQLSGKRCLSELGQVVCHNPVLSINVRGGDFRDRMLVRN